MNTRIVAVALAAFLALAACGGSSPSTPARAEGAHASTVTLPAPADGPLPDLPVSPEAAAASPLPELAVRRINGEGGFVQLKNELPSDIPLLVWFWAPH